MATSLWCCLKGWQGHQPSVPTLLCLNNKLLSLQTTQASEPTSPCLTCIWFHSYGWLQVYTEEDMLYIFNYLLLWGRGVFLKGHSSIPKVFAAPQLLVTPSRGGCVQFTDWFEKSRASILRMQQLQEDLEVENQSAKLRSTGCSCTAGPQAAGEKLLCIYIPPAGPLPKASNSGTHSSRALIK